MLLLRGVSTVLYPVGELVGRLVSPARCAACDGPLLARAAFCGPCVSTVERADPDPAGRKLAAFVYGGAVAEAVRRLKYGRRPDLARPLADLLWRSLEPHRPTLADCMVVPVPLHPYRLAERGYNQSALLASRVASRLGAPSLPLALARTRDTPRQAALGREERLANVAGAFRVRAGARLDDAHVLLVDDVATTCATLRACEAALLGAQAKAVAWAVLARAS